MKVKEKVEAPSAKPRVEIQKKNPSPYGGVSSSINRNSINKNMNSNNNMKRIDNPPPPPHPKQTPPIPSSAKSSLSKTNAVRPIGYMAKEYGNRGLKGISGKGSMSEGISKDDIKRVSLLAMFYSFSRFPLGFFPIRVYYQIYKEKIKKN